VLLVAPLALLALSSELADVTPHHKHGHHHGHHHHKKHDVAGVKNATAVAPKASNATLKTSNVAAPVKLMMKMKKLENEMTVKERQETAARTGQLEVNAPDGKLPADFSDNFAKEVAKATGCNASDVKVMSTTPAEGQDGVDEVIFTAPPEIIKAVQEQAADPDSKLAKGPLRAFLIAESEPEDVMATDAHGGKESAEIAEEVAEDEHKVDKEVEEHEAPDGLKPEDGHHAAEEADEVEEGDGDGHGDGEDETPVQSKGIDVDTTMPYGELEPFGREDTAQELTRGSIKESDEMVDQLERAEIAEEKRAVFRALTRLRGAAITSFDGVARSQTGNIDSYARTNHWRSTHPVRHLADEESDVGKWAFPDNADF